MRSREKRAKSDTFLFILPAQGGRINREQQIDSGQNTGLDSGSSRYAPSTIGSDLPGCPSRSFVVNDWKDAASYHPEHSTIGLHPSLHPLLSLVIFPSKINVQALWTSTYHQLECFLQESHDAGACDTITIPPALVALNHYLVVCRLNVGFFLHLQPETAVERYCGRSTVLRLSEFGPCNFDQQLAAKQPHRIDLLLDPTSHSQHHVSLCALPAEYMALLGLDGHRILPHSRTPRFRWHRCAKLVQNKALARWFRKWVQFKPICWPVCSSKLQAIQNTQSLVAIVRKYFVNKEGSIVLI